MRVNKAYSMFVRGSEKQDVGWNHLVTGQADNVTYPKIFPVAFYVTTLRAGKKRNIIIIKVCVAQFRTD